MMPDDSNVLASLLSMPVIDPMTAPEWNFHVALWTEPLSFLCTQCPAKDFSYPDIVTHLATAHAVEPQPTPLAADVLRGGGAKFNLPRETLMELATFRTEEIEGTTQYICLQCERAGDEHHSTDMTLFRQHMEQRHDGRLVKAPDDEPETDEPPQTETPTQDVTPLPTSPEPVPPSGASPQSDQSTSASPLSGHSEE